MHRTLATANTALGAPLVRRVALLVAALACVPIAHAQQTRIRMQGVPLAPKVYVSNSSANAVSVIDSATDTVRATIPVGTSPGHLALSADGARAYVPNTGSDSVSVVHTGFEAVIATITVADGPAIAAVTPNGARVYVGCANGIIDVIDTASSSVVSTITAGAPAAGYAIAGLALSPDGSRAYALWGDLVVIDTATNTITDRVYAGNNTTGLALAPDGGRIYVCAAFGYGAFSFYGTVAVVDAATLTVPSVIGTWSLPMSITISPDGTRAFVATPSTFVDTGYGAGYLPSPWVARIDLTTNTLLGGVNVGGPARGLAFTPDGARVYVAVPGAHAAKVLDPVANVVTGTVNVGGSPNGVAIAR